MAKSARDPYFPTVSPGPATELSTTSTAVRTRTSDLRMSRLAPFQLVQCRRAADAACGRRHLTAIPYSSRFGLLEIRMVELAIDNGSCRVDKWQLRGADCAAGAHSVEFELDFWPAIRSSRATLWSTFARRNSRELRWTSFAWYQSEGWRRRPDLNRGWRFCRFREVLYLVDSFCSLVSGAPRFSVVFGR
jgi:hypothetical protein